MVELMFSLWFFSLEGNPSFCMRALMNPTSTTQNKANDFGGENNLMIQGSGWRS